jgi:hypothetical protein
MCPSNLLKEQAFPSLNQIAKPVQSIGCNIKQDELAGKRFSSLQAKLRPVKRCKGTLRLHKIIEPSLFNYFPLTEHQDEVRFPNGG